MQIRTLTTGDLDAALALWAETEQLGPVPRAEVEKLLARDADLVLCAVDDGRLVGVVLGSSDGRRGWISRLAVTPDQRGNGVGRALVVELERRLAARGCARANLLVFAGNESGRRFWEQSGYGVMQDVVAYSKRLAAPEAASDASDAGDSGDDGPGC